jgi:hypothetical protein
VLAKVEDVVRVPAFVHHHETEIKVAANPFLSLQFANYILQMLAQR